MPSATCNNCTKPVETPCVPCDEPELDPVPLPVCGDGKIDIGEECDDAAMPSASCRANCTIPRCGDGILDTLSGETCDEGTVSATATCRANCTAPVCGDGVLDVGEECDKGDIMPCDTCRADCTIPLCGDGILDTLSGETCDEGLIASANCVNCRSVTSPAVVCGECTNSTGNRYLRS